jgi:hypothetical protein
MKFTDTVIQDGLNTLPTVRHGDFIAAMQHSLTVDPTTYEHSSFDKYWFTQRELYELRVLLLRPLAFQFLTEVDGTLTENDFNKRTSFNAYRAKYKRDPWLISVKPRIMMLTYTEWADLTFGKTMTFPMS